jgi:hypothetical protein
MLYAHCCRAVVKDFYYDGSTVDIAFVVLVATRNSKKRSDHWTVRAGVSIVNSQLMTKILGCQVARMLLLGRYLYWPGTPEDRPYFAEVCGRPSLCLILYYLSHGRCQYTKSCSGSDHTLVLDDIL